MCVSVSHGGLTAVCIYFNNVTILLTTPPA